MKMRMQAGGMPIKLWIDNVAGEQIVPVEHKAMEQLYKVASLPFIYKHVAVMPDVHLGIGATVGSVIATKGAIIPAAVGVDIGCGMLAVRTSMTAENLDATILKKIRESIEKYVPMGVGGGHTSNASVDGWSTIDYTYQTMIERYPEVAPKTHPALQLGSLGGGNHFIELCLDETNRVWIMLHSGSRGLGNRIGSHFISLAKKDMEQHIQNLPDKDLAYFSEGSPHFKDYIQAVLFAQRYAMLNRVNIRNAINLAICEVMNPWGFSLALELVSCHHNYVSNEAHFGNLVWITRKGAVNADVGILGIIPGSMGKKSYIVRGKGNLESFRSCSHGAGRVMSRGEAKRKFTIADLAEQTEGVECRKDAGVIDEIPSAYKDLDSVMEAQGDLVEIVHTLKAVLTVKG